MEVMKAIKTKRAVRVFRKQPLTGEDVEAILFAGRRAQSAKNMQPWDFIAIQDRETLVKLSKLGTYASHLAGAALGIVIVTPPPESRFSVLFDAGQSAAYMQLAAWSLGIASCLATIYQLDDARALLGFPSNRVAYIAISFGYPEDQAVLTAPPQKGGRRLPDEVIHREKW